MAGENKRPLSARDGKVYIDGDLVADACKFQILFTPSVWEGKSLSEKGTNRRYTGFDIKGTISQWKTTPFWKRKIMEYIETGRTPEMTMTGVNDDENSDYYDINGTDTITAVGCVLTGDIPLMDLDTDGDVVKEELSFGAKRVI